MSFPRLTQKELQEIVDANPLRVGGKIRHNHVAHHCSGSSDAAILSRDKDGYYYYCFRCGGRGHLRDAAYFAAPRAPSSAVATSEPRSVKCPPDDATTEWHAWPSEVRGWLSDAHVSTVIARDAGMVWSDKQAALWIPVRQHSLITTGCKLAGYVERHFNPKRYYARTDDKDSFYGYYVAKESKKPDTVVLVEDVVSAIRVSEVLDCISIMGVHPKPAMIEAVLKNGYRNAIVFLDGDNPTVKMKARQIGKRLPFVNTKIVETGSDPKSYTTDELDKLLLG